MTIPSVFPTGAGDFKASADAPRRKNDGFGSKEQEAAALTFIAERARDTAVILQQCHHRAFHVNVHPEMDAMVLQRADHFKAGSISHVSEARITVAAKVALKDSTILCAIEQSAPGF